MDCEGDWLAEVPWWRRWWWWFSSWTCDSKCYDAFPVEGVQVQLSSFMVILNLYDTIKHSKAEVTTKSENESIRDQLLVNFTTIKLSTARHGTLQNPLLRPATIFPYVTCIT